MHASASPQALPQRPQWFEWLVVFTQAPAHATCPDGHTQWPPTHDAPMGHAAPHMPQLRVSVCRLVQALPQRVCPTGHWHRPATHVCPIEHAFPHAPQWAPLVLRSTHAEPHIALGAVHALATHAPPMHACHALPRVGRPIGHGYVRRVANVRRALFEGSIEQQRCLVHRAHVNGVFVARFMVLLGCVALVGVEVSATAVVGRQSRTRRPWQRASARPHERHPREDARALPQPFTATHAHRYDAISCCRELPCYDDWPCASAGALPECSSRSRPTPRQAAKRARLTRELRAMHMLR